MIANSVRKSMVLVILGALGVLAFAAPVFAGNVWLGDDALSHDYIQRDGVCYVSISDIESPLGLSVIYDGQRLLIGGTVNGSMSVGPNSETVNVGGRYSLNFENRIFQDNGEWYVPELFLVRVLGVKPVFEPETGELHLYPMVVSISPSDGMISIRASLRPDFQPFELDGPSRRVIDFNGMWLTGPPVEVQGSDIGLNDIAVLRASQFSFDPPVARVVLEWEGDEAPRHTLLPDNKMLTVVIGSATLSMAAAGNRNLLETSAEPYVEIEVSGHSPEENGEQDGAGIVVPQVPVFGGENLPDENPLGPEVSQIPEIEVIPGESDFPESAENWSLAQLGWDVGYEMDADGGISIEINTPPFEDISDFTLAGNGMRLVIDLLGTEIPGDERRVEGIGDIRQVRIAQFQPSTTRIVLDLSRVVAYQIEDDPAEGLITVRLLSGDLSGKTFVIDPGHGGEDPGAMLNGIQEKDLNLEMAFYLQEFLEAQGAEIVLTRQTDEYVTLAQRIEVAQRLKPDLFICIHNNATEVATAIQGTLIIYDEAEYLSLYRLVHRGIAARTGVTGLGPVPDTRGLYILRYAEETPVLFVEGAFLTNPIDFARLCDPSRTYARNIMAGVMDGILAYYAGRDLPPVVYPEYGVDIRTGVFDLAGRPIVLPGDEVGDASNDDGSAWYEPDEDEGSDDGESASSDDEDDEGDDEGDGDDDEEEDSDRVRGRGAYRYD